MSVADAAAQWQIVLTGVDAAGHVTTDAITATRPDATAVAVSGAARAQLSAILEEMIAPLVARHEERVVDMGRTIGHLEAERDQATRERDALRAEVERLRAEDAPSTQRGAPGATEQAGAGQSGHRGGGGGGGGRRRHDKDGR